MSGIGERIRDRRKEMGMTQEDAARRAGALLNTFARLERGEVRDPHISTLRGLAEALDTSVAWIIGEEGQ